MELSWKMSCGAAVGATLFVVGMAGCGSDVAMKSSPPTRGTQPAGVDVAAPPTEAGASSDTDAAACRLASAGDVTTAMKQPMKAVDGVGAEICVYAAAADPSVILQIQTFATRADAAVYTQVEATSEHVAGVGDDAFWNPTLDLMFVAHGERCFIVVSPSLATLTGDPQASKAAMVQLATTVLAHF